MTTSSFRASRAPHLRAASAFALAALLSSLTIQSSFAAPAAKPADKPADPRVPISVETTPGDGDSLFKITKPGSYYLAGNIAGVDGKSGIEIGSANVTLDLNGFALEGTALAIDGIRVDAPSAIENVTIRNGSVSGWGRHGVNLAKHFTSDAFAESSLLESLQVSRNFADGIRASSNSTVRGCTALYNSGTGILAYSGSVIENCTANGNWAGIQVTYGSVRGCSASNNSGPGIMSYSSSVVDSSASYNGSRGISGTNSSVVKNCTAWGNTWGYESLGSIIEGSVARENTTGGILGSGGTIVGNTVYASADLTRTPGIVAGAGARVAENTVSGGSVGIRVSGSHSRIEDNNLINNDVGLKVEGAYNLIIRNSARNTSGVNWDIAANNRAGAFVAPTLNGAINGSTGGNGSGTTDPFANLSF